MCTTITRRDLRESVRTFETCRRSLALLKTSSVKAKILCIWNWKPVFSRGITFSGIQEITAPTLVLVPFTTPLEQVNLVPGPGRFCCENQTLFHVRLGRRPSNGRFCVFLGVGWCLQGVIPESICYWAGKRNPEHSTRWRASKV